jgi:hypothetical protein
MRTKFSTGLFSLVLVLAMSLGAVQAGVQPVPSAPATAITVNSSGDLPDLTGGSGVCETASGNGKCTLRAAIQTAEYTAGSDVITVNTSQVVSIGPTSPLPVLGTGDVTIIGNGVFLSGVNAGSGAVGFEISSSDNKIQGFRIFGFSSDGIRILGGSNNVIGVDGDGVNDGTEGNWIYNQDLSYGIYVNGDGTRISGNYIGTSDGGSPAANRWGISIQVGTGNLIGTDGDGVSDTLERNVISGNSQYGIEILTDSNIVAGNYIGVEEDGDEAMGNDYGIWIADGAAYNVIGTDGNGIGDTAERNVIAGNDRGGVVITGVDTNYNRVAGNYIGVDASGSLALGNSPGVSVGGGARYNVVGTNLDGQGDTAERNVISGQSGTGVALGGEGTRGNKVAGNYIGLDATGLSARSNRYGVHVSSGASNNTIGGAAVAAPNVISGNENYGIWLEDTGEDNLILGNLIGTDNTGLAAVPNGGAGVYIDNSAGNRIGGTAAGTRNVIAGNTSAGVSIRYSGSSYNDVQGNYIGVGKNGVTPLGNGNNGVVVYDGAHHNTIGGVPVSLLDGPAGPAANGGNVIAHNGLYGVRVNGSSVVGNAIRGNAIYSNADLGIYAEPDVGIPVLTRAVAYDEDNLLSLSGTLSGTPNKDHELDFFVSEACDPSGEGEGQNYVGTLSLFGTPSGATSFVSVTFPGSYTPGHFVTATATDEDGSSSQFSWCFTITADEYLVYLPMLSK